jgi:hypothetical protein
MAALRFSGHANAEAAPPARVGVGACLYPASAPVGTRGTEPKRKVSRGAPRCPGQARHHRSAVRVVTVWLLLGSLGSATPNALDGRGDARPTPDVPEVEQVRGHSPFRPDGRHAHARAVASFSDCHDGAL